MVCLLSSDVRPPGPVSPVIKLCRDPLTANDLEFLVAELLVDAVSDMMNELVNISGHVANMVAKTL